MAERILCNYSCKQYPNFIDNKSPCCYYCPRKEDCVEACLRTPEKCNKSDIVYFEDSPKSFPIKISVTYSKCTVVQASSLEEAIRIVNDKLEEGTLTYPDTGDKCSINIKRATDEDFGIEILDAE